MEYLLCIVAYSVVYRNSYCIIIIASKGLESLLRAVRPLYLK